VSTHVWINGQAEVALLATDRGLVYGDGLFETMRLAHGAVPLLSRHLARLEASCKRLEIALDMEQLRAEIDGFLESLVPPEDCGVIKLVVTRGAGGRGYRAPVEPRPTRILIQQPTPDYPAAWWSEGVVVRYCDMRMGANPRLAGMKHLNRLEQVLARMEWSEEDIAEGLMSDPKGRLVEGISTNLFVVSGGRLLTPAIESCGVAGVMRQFILDEVVPRLGISAEVTNCERAVVIAAQEIFLCNAVVGVWPVRKLGNKTWSVGAVTRRIQAAVQNALES
jgi:4-amino-4-deoxychorismate lyase